MDASINMTLTASRALKAQGLSFSWPERHVFTDWSAELSTGLTWLRGANGTGKSTLLKLLAGVLPPLTGQLSLTTADGAVLDLGSQPIACKREIFWCGPGSIAFDHLSPLEYLGFMQGLYPRFDANAVAVHVAGLGLTAHLHNRIAALSTGTQRKVWLVVALCAGTRLRLLDEPLNALDTASLTYLHGVLQAATQDKATAWLVASHEAPVGHGARELTLV